MNENLNVRLETANLYLERLAEGRFPFSDTMAGMDSDLNSVEVIRSIYYVRDTVKEILERGGIDGAGVQNNRLNCSWHQNDQQNQNDHQNQNYHQNQNDHRNQNDQQWRNGSKEYEPQEELKNASRPRRIRRKFPLECLEDFVFESDKSIMTFVAQLRELAGDGNTKGMSYKRITDWLKAKGYLVEVQDAATGQKTTNISPSGEDAGIYYETRTTRFGQEYQVIIYSEKAQRWLIEQMPSILA